MVLKPLAISISETFPLPGLANKSNWFELFTGDFSELLAYVTPELRKLVYDIEHKINELDNVINQTKSRIDEIKTIVGEQEQAQVNNWFHNETDCQQR